MPIPPVEVWFRNPNLYIRELVELRVPLIAWDRGVLRKKSIEPSRFADLYYPADVDWRCLVIGEQGCAELSRGHAMHNPVAVYPAWEYGAQHVDELVELLANPVGLDRKACDDESVPPDERPVFGQRHLVVVLRAPNVTNGPGRQLVRLLQELQEEFPKADILVHGLYSYRVNFGCGFRVADLDARTRAAKGDLELPNGRHLPLETAAKTQLQWINMLGYSVSDLEVPRNRCLFNIKAALWAAQHYDNNLRFKSRESPGQVTTVDIESPIYEPPTANAVFSRRQSPTFGDKYTCDTCSLAPTCKYVRAGAVCSLPDSEPSSLARFFRTRDSDTIIDGLGSLLAAQTNRLEKGLEDEDVTGELDPEVTKILNTLFANGVKLAKLVNPALARAGAANISLQQVNMATKTELPTSAAFTAAVVAQIEATGVARQDITADMIKAFVPASEVKAITTTASGAE